MQFIVVLQPLEQFQTQGLPADFAEVEQAEEVQAKALYKGGAARQIWAIKTERKGAIGLFEAASGDELQSLVNSFPMVQKGYVQHMVFPVGPFAAFAQ